jgi:hypothetical protein
VAEEMDMGAALNPRVRFALVGEPAFTQRVVCEDEHKLTRLVRFGECGGKRCLAEAELAMVHVSRCEQCCGQADEADRKAGGCEAVGPALSRS